MKFTVLFGIRHDGEPSDIACLIFSSFEKGMKYCLETFGFGPDIIREGEDDHITAHRWAIEHSNEDKEQGMIMF